MLMTNSIEKRLNYVFVLWANNFEELVATTFITQMREKGFHVKVVGLNGKIARGLHGLTLAADLTLGQAQTMIERVICVILPCNKVGLQPFEDDPRLYDFLDKVNHQNAKVVVGDLSKTDLRKSKLLHNFADGVTACTDVTYLLSAAQEIGADLLLLDR